MQNQDSGDEELTRDLATPPVLGAIPDAVVDAMGLVMREAQKAAQRELEGIRAQLDNDRSVFESQREKLKAELNEAQTALEAEKTAHQQTIRNSESLRTAATKHDQIVAQLKQERDALQQRCTQLETQVSDLSNKGATRAQEQARLSVEQKHLESELLNAQETLSATEKRRLETADRLKKAQLEIYTLKAEVGDMVAELKRLKRAPIPKEPAGE